jgi:serine/threonine protein kinase
VSSKPFLQFFVHIAKKLASLHAACWVHRGLKPGNTIWLPSRNEWALIDFGCAARLGSFCGLSFSLYYAPPKVIAAYKAGETVILADSAADVWALGVRMLCSSTQIASNAQVKRVHFQSASMLLPTDAVYTTLHSCAQKRVACTESREPLFICMGECLVSPSVVHAAHDMGASHSDNVPWAQR